MIRFRSGAVLAALFCLLVVTRAHAQQQSLTGTIRDASGVLQGAAVTLRDPAGASRQTRTDADGRYRFDGLSAGAYEITITREGFAAATRALTLSGESRTVDVTLQISGISATVEVNDVAERGTASGMDVPNRDLPNYVVSISQETLQEQGINDLASALENVSGVITQVQYGVYEWYTIGGITQQSGNDFLYVDGMTLTGNRSQTQLNNIEEVQVLKGPNSILFGGSGAGQGGAINLIRKKPSAVRTHDIQYRAGAFGLQEFTGGTTGAVFGLERLVYRIDGSYSNSDGWRQNSSERLNISPSLTWLLSSRMRLTANQTFIRDDYTLDAGLRRELIDREGIPYDRKMNPAGDFQTTRDWQNQIVYTWNVTDRLKFTNSFFTRRNRDQYLDAESMAYNAAQDLVTRAYLYYQHNRRPTQNQADVMANYEFWGMRHRPFVRYEFSNQHNFTNRTGNAPGTSNALAMPLPSVPVADFIAGTWVDTAPVYRDFPLTRRDFSTNRFHSVTLQDQFYPVEWLAANVTMRRGNYHRNTHNDAYDNGTLVSVGNETRITNNVKSNWRVGAVLIPTETWPAFIRSSQPYVSYNTSFNPVNQVQADGTPLDPIINESVEVGNKWAFFNNRFTVLAAARRLQDRNLVVSLGGGFFEQIGTTTTHNADIDMQGNITRNVRLIAAWGWADSMIDARRSDGTAQPNAGRRFPHAPKHTARLSVTRVFPLADRTLISVNLGGRYVSTYFLNSANTTTMPDRTTFDGAITLRHQDLDVAVNIGNILDRRRYFVSQINGGGLLYPGRPLNAAVTLRYRFR